MNAANDSPPDWQPSPSPAPRRGAESVSRDH
jgi:hypothetical protein